MMSRYLYAALFACAAMPVYATTYTIEPDHAQGVFRWNHLGFSNPAAQFSQAKGTLDFDPADPTKASVEVTIPLGSLETGLPDLDEVFRSAEFFDTASFPTASFRYGRTAPQKRKDDLNGYDPGCSRQIEGIENNRERQDERLIT